MSELKEHQFCESDEFFREYPGPLSNETHLYYLKSEADKVIAEKEEKLDDLRYTVAVLRKDSSHHKYKRCLAMANYCHESAMWLEENGVNKCTVFMLRWEKRWLELAEKFKPNKEAK